MFGMNPLDILNLPLPEFHRLCALAHEGQRQNIRPLMRLANKGKAGGWIASIAAAIYAGNKASK